MILTKTYFYLIIGILFLFLSCDEEKEEALICADNPTENIEWIKELIENENSMDSTNGLEIVQYNYQGNTVFSVDSCVNYCSDSLVKVYDCDQNLVCEFGGVAGVNTCPNFENESVEQGVVFSNGK